MTMRFISTAALTTLVSLGAQAQSSLFGVESGRYEIRRSSGQSEEVLSKASPSRAPASQSSKAVVPKSRTPQQETAVVESQAEISTDNQSQKEILAVQPIVAEHALPSLNKLEFEFSPVFLNYVSKSNYSFRNYNANMQAFQFKGSVWLSEKMGLKGSILNSLGGDIGDSSATSSRASAQYEEIKLNLLGRNFFNGGNLVDTVEFRFIYLDSRFKVSSSAIAKLGYKSTGLGVGASLKLPTSTQYSWLIGGELFPRISHEELAGTAGVSSGTGPRSSRMSLNVGGEYSFNHRSVFTWGIDLEYDKNFFDRSASTVDPVSNVTPQNVGVDITSTLFKLGYRWGR